VTADIKFREIPLTGRVITSVDSTQISKPEVNFTNFSELKNLRYNDSGIEAVKGMSPITNSNLAGVLKSGFFYNKLSDFNPESFVYAQTNYAGSALLYFSAVEPFTTDTFTTVTDYVITTGAGTGVFANAPQSQMIYCNGKESLIYGGTEMFLSAMWLTGTAGDNWDMDFTGKANNTKDTFTLAKGSDGEVRFRISTVRPVSEFKIYVDTPNTTATGLSKISVWTDLGWQNFTTVTDNTSVGGVTLAQTGTMAFSGGITGNIQQRYKFGTTGYWYKINTLTTIDSTVKISHIAGNAVIQPMIDVWDGSYVSCISFKMEEPSINTFRDYTVANISTRNYVSAGPTTYIAPAQMDTGESLYIGFDERLCGIDFGIGFGNSYGGNPMVVQYWDGKQWANLSHLFDHTSNGGFPFNKSGQVYWSTPPEMEEKRTTIDDSPALFFYRFSFGVGTEWLFNGLHIDFVGGIRAPKTIGNYKFPVFAQSRVFLCNDQDGKKNSVLVSAVNTATVFNGLDSTEFIVGNGDELTAGIGLYKQTTSSLYDQVVFFTKNSTWNLLGTSPSDWKLHQVENTIGCVAPETLKSATVNVKNSGSVNIAIWQGAHGIYSFDGTNLITLSDDIRDIFDSLNPLLLNTSTAFYDSNLQEYHWLSAKGTAIDTEWVLSLRYMKWFEIDRTGRDLTAGFEVSNSEGLKAIYAGGNNKTISTNCDIYRLENSTTFDDLNITYSFATGNMNLSGFLPIQDKLRWMKFVSKNITTSVTATVYTDGGSGTTMAYDMTTSNEMAQTLHGFNTNNATYHKIKFSVTSSEQFQPLALLVGYKPIRADRN